MLNLVASNLDSKMIGALGQTCRSIAENIVFDTRTIQFFAKMRNMKGHISTLDQLRVAEAFSHLNGNNRVRFEWGRVEIDRASRKDIAHSLSQVAKLLASNRSLQISIEAHCGLEGRFHMPIPQQAKIFTKGRAQALCSALFEEARSSNVTIERSQVRVVAWGYQRPLFYAFRRGYPVPPSQVDGEKSAQNRRVEFYLREVGTYFEIPRRRKRSEIPGEDELSDHSSVDDGDSEQDNEEEEEDNDESDIARSFLARERLLELQYYDRLISRQHELRTPSEVDDSEETSR